MIRSKIKTQAFICISIGMLFCSCGSKYHQREKMASTANDSIASQQEAPPEDMVDETTEAEPRILFLLYRVYAKNGAHQKRAVLMDKNIAQGNLKIKNQQLKFNREGNFECIELDEQKNPLQKYYFENPVEKHVEYASPDGILENKKVSLDSADTFLRIQLHPKTKFIALREIEKNLASKEYLMINAIE